MGDAIANPDDMIYDMNIAKCSTAHAVLSE